MTNPSELERNRKLNGKIVRQEFLRRQKLRDLCKQYEDKLKKRGYGLSLILSGWGSNKLVLEGNSHIEECFFDNGKLIRVDSGIQCFSSETRERTLYECVKCHTPYFQKLSNKERQKLENQDSEPYAAYALS